MKPQGVAQRPFRPGQIAGERSTDGHFVPEGTGLERRQPATRQAESLGEMVDCGRSVSARRRFQTGGLAPPPGEIELIAAPVEHRLDAIESHPHAFEVSPIPGIQGREQLGAIPSRRVRVAEPLRQPAIGFLGGLRGFRGRAEPPKAAAFAAGESEPCDPPPRARASPAPAGPAGREPRA